MVTSLQSLEGAKRSGNDRPRWIILMSALPAMIAAAVLFLFDPSQHSFYPTCLLHRVTGLLCPGCGSLRALHQLLNGHVVAAIHFNALLVASLPLFAWIATRAVIRRLRNQPFLPSFQLRWLWCGLVLLIAFGILRNLPFAHAFWLAP
ncbi:MAG: DUF2752 domain-containing protein [Verrucomicrobia bacterium]|nr:MAG: DUF2752 domain-containing protein [Verrucomicrobiota bacterium]